MYEDLVELECLNFTINLSRFGIIGILFISVSVFNDRLIFLN